jgi:hypothetical protein
MGTADGNASAAEAGRSPLGNAMSIVFPAVP